MDNFNVYGLYERTIDKKRIILPEGRQFVKKHVLFSKNENDRYIIRLLWVYNELINKLKENAYNLSNEEYQRRLRELEELYLDIDYMAQIDTAGRIQLPEDYLNSKNDDKVFLLGKQNCFELFSSREEFEEYKKVRSK